MAEKNDVMIYDVIDLTEVDSGKQKRTTITGE